MPARRSWEPGLFRRPTGQLFEIGDCVEVSGLESEAGRKLNGQVGVISSWNEETGRFDVRFGLEKEVSLKPSNLKKPDLVAGDCVEVSGLESESGKTLNGQKGFITSFVEEEDCYQVCFEPERRVSLKPENVERPPLGVGDSVEVCGLESESGKLLNGQRGVITQRVEDTGRFQVGFISPEKVVNLKPENLTRPPLGPRDTVLAVGLESESGMLLNGQKGFITMHVEETGRFEVQFKLVKLGAEHLTKVDVALSPGDAVEVTGLAPESGGKALNGQKGLITKYLKESGMYHIKFGPSKSMSLKLENLRKFGPSAGDNVEVSGLTSESGRQLNGQRGVVMTYAEDTGRFQVRFAGDKVVSLKAENLGAWKSV
eukprot:CAMPEP_0175223464 /NCGR_PEP_ID=MMETSP0093-20121207/21347_1 /TAXON_ID=311494 /ORGANISM="Alexandrium monilatum, Strain CCMP3105" /LENGTH=370 /DNA_ID=CAMNT_0016517071 /DNA_START=42 /DNA_END=1154 /DNA_ORIENTATION=+